MRGDDVRAPAAQAQRPRLRRRPRGRRPRTRHRPGGPGVPAQRRARPADGVVGLHTIETLERMRPSRTPPAARVVREGEEMRRCRPGSRDGPSRSTPVPRVRAWTPGSTSRTRSPRRSRTRAAPRSLLRREGQDPAAHDRALAANAAGASICVAIRIDGPQGAGDVRVVRERLGPTPPPASGWRRMIARGAPCARSARRCGPSGSPSRCCGRPRCPRSRSTPPTGAHPAGVARAVRGGRAAVRDGAGRGLTPTSGAAGERQQDPEDERRARSRSPPAAARWDGAGPRPSVQGIGLAGRPVSSARRRSPRWRTSGSGSRSSCSRP